MTAQDLKNSILQQAVQGKLLPQNPDDEPASELLKKIFAERQRLIDEGKIKNPPQLPPISDDEKPFDIPDSWQWVRWGELAYSIQYGYNAPATSSGKIKMLRISDIQNNSVNWDTVPFCKIANNEIENYLLKPNDILFARTGGTVGKSLLVENLPEKVIFAGYLIRTNYNKNLNPQYLKAFMESPIYWAQLKIGTFGTAQPNCNGKTLSKMIVPLPPLAEQKRIVERLEEILPLIERYGELEQRLTKLDKEFPDKLKKSLLQQAIQGKLTRQLSTDGDASDLLEKIRAEKSKLIAEGKIKKEKPLPPISAEEIPFDIPDNWQWVRLGAICNYGVNENISPANMEVGKLLIDLEDIEKNSGRLINKKFFDGYNAKSSKYIFKRGDVLYGKLRVYLNKVIVADDDGYCTSEILPLDFGKNIFNKYAKYFLMSPLFVSYATQVSYGTKMPRLGTKDGRLALFSLPPIAEQKRIVERLEELLPLCDRLREKFTD